ncbi:hypothetical protein CBER1_08948 [Cercospora berteroae]|uniref:Tyrosine specific protein phosphatases domain-containing protein n=1 Tax=Cercospora berteroae TaxID=357750 RepID=A0A2S6BVX9_9PEZI|nr:hypothetical protein CBER1_08948 [Cercospora berteroae]
MPYLRDSFLSGVELATKVTSSGETIKDKTSKMSSTKEGHSGAWHSNGEVQVEALDGASTTSSQPPTPPESRSPTPRVTLMPCPVRLLPLVPAPNYGTVVDNTMYRSAFPQARNIEFMETLKLKSILTLVTKTASCEHYDNFVWQHGINRKILDVEPNKEGKVKTNFDTLCDAILFALNPMHHPVYIHCNQGRHRTGCVVACIRKIQQWPMDEILLEYMTYADPKPREGDIELIKSFDPELVHQYGRRHGLLKGFKKGLKDLGRERVDSFNSVYELASSLPSHNTASICSSDSSQSSDTSEKSDGLLLMASRYLPSESALLAGGDGSKVDPSLRQDASECNSGLVVPGLETDKDLADTLLITTSEGEQRIEMEDVRIVSTSATTPPIAIRGRS